MAAAYYIYRNLHVPEGFSVRHRGRVVEVLSCFVAHNVKFKVSEVGRQRVLSEKRKNVHAFVVAESYSPIVDPESKPEAKISYDPYLSANFTVNSQPITEAAEVIFTGGRCYLPS